MALINVFGVANPVKFAAALRRFPRSLPWGYALMLLGTACFIWFVKNEPISDFEPLKPALYTLFIAVGVGSCLFVKDFLAVRGLSVVIMLLAKVMVDTARFHDSSWRLVIITWAYLLVVAGIVFTVSPYRMRDVIYWKTANEGRTRMLSGLRMAFGLFVAVLGFTVFKAHA
ncbi:MAG: hypothetical protein JWM68_2805 [Verrucomicrobiales bacterium]|nr:hypothetical protein [Verrucomicrobiales bacterium]